MSDIEDIIHNSIDDAIQPIDDATDTVDTTVDDTSAEPQVETASTETPSTETEASTETTETASPETKVDQTVGDDFDKRHGLSAQLPNGRENRIPYSRVKKIVTNAEKAARESVTKDFDKQLGDFKTKVTDYEGRLTKVAEFEKVITDEPQRFLGMLSTLPQYQEFFESVRQLVAQSQQPATATETAPVDDGMPQPDQTLTDGSKVYSLEGLKALNTWNREQARKEAMTEADKKYGQMYEAWRSNEKVQQLIPKVQAQITEARTWPQFNENEAEIVKVLQANPNVTLERAYQHVVLPKFQSAAATTKEREAEIRNEARKNLLEEMKKRPTSTSVSTSGAKPGAPTAGPKSLEDVIRESMQGLR